MVEVARRSLLGGAPASLLLAAPAVRAAAADEASEIRLLDRLTYGPRPQDLERLRSLGRRGWIAEQLGRGAGDPSVEAISALASATQEARPLAEVLVDLEAVNRAANALADPDQKKVAQRAYQDRLNALGRQASSRWILLALYSPNQLHELMSWFWLNHFNVFAGKNTLRAMVGDYADRAVRPHALGRFRDLVMATLKHPAMIRYLDNADNAAGRINENYAREIMELHTLGVGGGYAQADVVELARVLTGVGIDLRPEVRVRPELQGLVVREGAFTFNPQRHDFGEKTLLGRRISGRGFGEVEEAVEILCGHPATARHVSGRLVAYLAGERAPARLVEAAARRFQETSGDIREVVSAILLSPDFEASLGTKLKDPVRFVFSAVRAAYPDRTIQNAQPVQGWLSRLGEPLFGRETPDGYPLAEASWSGPGQMAARFEAARQIGAGPSGLFHQDGVPDPAAYPDARGRLWWEARRLLVSADTSKALGEATSPQEWNALFLSSPEFMSC